MDLKQKALEFHKINKCKIATSITTPIKNREDLSLAYTPGVGLVSKEIAENKELVYEYTIKSHTVGVITDGSAVLGLGNIGPEAALPVMEGKAALFKTFADIDAFPICLGTQDSQEIIKAVRLLAPVFGGINLEDISAPRCFEIEDSLQDLGIPVMHDDQHGTAVVCLAGLINAAKVVGKDLASLKVVISGAGAAGNAITKILTGKVADIVVIDSKGVINKSRTDLDPYKQRLVSSTNKYSIEGGLAEALVKADIFIGVSKAGLLTPEHIKLMNPDPIIFAMANPVPEIMPELAREAGAKVVASGRSDYPNQVNNSLAFPGIFKGALSVRAARITEKMKYAAALALAGLDPDPTEDKIIPGPFDPGIVDAVSKAVVSAI